MSGFLGVDKKAKTNSETPPHWGVPCERYSCVFGGGAFQPNSWWWFVGLKKEYYNFPERVSTTFTPSSEAIYDAIYDGDWAQVKTRGAIIQEKMHSIGFKIAKVLMAWAAFTVLLT